MRGWLVLAGLFFALLYTISARAQTNPTPTKTLLLYVEAEGGADPASVRVILRRAVPPGFLILDVEPLREAVTRKGEKLPLTKRLYAPTTQATVVDRIRSSARDLHADAVVVASAKATPKDPRARMQLRIFFVDAEVRDTPPPITFSVVIPIPRKIKLDADAARVADAIGPTLAKLREIAPPGAAGTPIRAVYNPLKPDTSNKVKTETKPATPTPTPTPTAEPPKAIPISAGTVVRVFPVGGIYSAFVSWLSIPLSKSVSLSPSVVFAYLAPVSGGQTDVPYGVGVGFNYTISSNVRANLGGDFSPNFAAGGAAGMGIQLFPALQLNLRGTITRYTIGFAFDGVVFMGNGYVEVATRPFPWLLLAPHGMYFVYDRDLTTAKTTPTALAIGLAPYPILAMVGIKLAYEAKRLSPYVASRHFFYEANIGDANTVGVGVRLNLGSDYVDARLGAIFSNAKGPYSNAQLATIPVLNVEAGWAF